MRLGRTALLAALAFAAFSGPPASGDDATGPPTVERIDLDEKAGRVDEALQGWIARYLGVAAPAERAQALQRYVALASKNPAEPDPWLRDVIQQSGAGIRAVAGRRVVVVLQDEVLAGADPARMAAVFDALELAVERITGVRPPTGRPSKGDPRPRDLAERYLCGVWPLPDPAAKQAYDAFAQAPDEKSRGPALAFAVGGVCASASVSAALNRRARLMDPAVSHVVRDLAARETGDSASTAAADVYRARAKELFENDWAPGCLPGEWIPSDEPLAHLFFAALDAGRAAKLDPFDAMRAFLTEPRRDVGWDRLRVASPRDMALEPLAAVLAPGAAGVFRRAGLLPAGAAFEEMKVRVLAEDLCREAAEDLRNNLGGAAAHAYRGAADTLSPGIAADEMLLEALAIEERDDPKKARAAAQRLGLAEGFDFLGPLPVTRGPDNVVAASRLMPLAVATAEGRHPLKVKEPAEVSLKWAEVKDPYDRLVERTPWGDKKGITWGGSVVAAMKWTKDIGRLVRLRPCRSDWNDVVVLADGRPLDKWPDGSVLVPGAKGTEIVLVSPGRITCSVPWRDAKSVEADLASVAAEKDAVLALRPWAARRVAAALPSIVAALTRLPDADAVRGMTLLAPYRGGDAAACDAMLAHAKARPDVLAAYLDACRGTRDAAVLERLVGLAIAADARPELVARVQSVLDGALFRKVTEKGAALAALWERGKKWIAASGFAEAEEVRDLYDATPGFRVLADAGAWGRACLAPRGANAGHGQGYLAIDVPEGPGGVCLAVRWQPSGGGRLALHGYVTDGKKFKPFAVDMPGPSTEKPEWGFDVFDLGSIPRGRIVVAIEDPCASGCRLDAIAIGPKPLE